MASPAEPTSVARSEARWQERQSEALGFSTALHSARQELEQILTELRRHRFDGGDEKLPEALVLQGARLQAECEELEAALRRARAGCAGLIHDEARQTRISSVA